MFFQPVSDSLYEDKKADRFFQKRVWDYPKNQINFVRVWLHLLCLLFFQNSRQSKMDFLRMGTHSLCLLFSEIIFLQRKDG